MDIPFFSSFFLIIGIAIADNVYMYKLNFTFPNVILQPSMFLIIFKTISQFLISWMISCGSI